MADDDPRVQQLLDELLDSHATPEDVCGSCPELLPVVRDRWQELRRLRADLDALLPAPPEPTLDAPASPPGDPPPQPPDGKTLPQIPGYKVGAVLGRDRIRDVLAGLLRANTQLMSRVNRTVTIGEIALLYTDFEGTQVDASGKTLEARFKAIEVLRRQPDGTWKLVVGDPNGRG